MQQPGDKNKVLHSKGRSSLFLPAWQKLLSEIYDFTIYNVIFKAFPNVGENIHTDLVNWHYHQQMGKYSSSCSSVSTVYFLLCHSFWKLNVSVILLESSLCYVWYFVAANQECCLPDLFIAFDWFTKSSRLDCSFSLKTIHEKGIKDMSKYCITKMPEQSEFQKPYREALNLRQSCWEARYVSMSVLSYSVAECFVSHHFQCELKEFKLPAVYWTDIFLL